MGEPAVSQAQTVSPGHELNAICPYFTMFPLSFPLGILTLHAKRNERVIDPFCGRGTTNFAARLTNLSSVGIDSSPIAHAITAAKLVSPTVTAIEHELDEILSETETAIVPSGEFWTLAFHPDVLIEICRLRAALCLNCSSSARIALRGLLLGALHGPLQRTPSYLSNQAPRTYAPKPAYAARYWSEHTLTPPKVDIRSVIGKRAHRFYGRLQAGHGDAWLADSRNEKAFSETDRSGRFSWVITSPPYYGMKTYIADQWLRNWLLGGPEQVDYNMSTQLSHRNPDGFVSDLRTVWSNTRRVCHDHATMVIRFGGIRDRRVEPINLVKESLRNSGWRLLTTRAAGDARSGKRQADSFLSQRSKPLIEYDVWAQAS